MSTSLEYGLATVVRDPARFPTIIAPERYGRRTNVDRYRDGNDAVPVGTARVHKRVASIAMRPPELVDDLHALDTYTARNTDLFEPWHKDMVEDARAALIESLGDVMDWDCHGCKRAQVTAPGATSCPTCGTPS